MINASIPALPRIRLIATLSCGLLVLFSGCSAQSKPSVSTSSAGIETSTVKENDQERAGTFEGEKVARELIQHGHVYLQFHWGRLAGRSLVTNSTPNFAEHLRSALRIECRDVGTSPRTDYERAYAAAFNRVMIAHLETIHGKGFIFKAEEAAAYEQGKIDGEKTLAEGMLAIETMGLPPRSRGAFMDILKKEYGIQVRVTAASIVSSSIKGHARGFNEVMLAEIEKKFGVGLLLKVEAEAESRFDDKR